MDVHAERKTDDDLLSDEKLKPMGKSESFKFKNI